MMALFIVLWLMNSSNQVKEAVGGYFKDPTGNSKMVGSDMRGRRQLHRAQRQHEGVEGAAAKIESRGAEVR
jgi:flagellar motor protein MotB